MKHSINAYMSGKTSKRLFLICFLMLFCAYSVKAQEKFTQTPDGQIAEGIEFYATPAPAGKRIEDIIPVPQSCNVCITFEEQNKSRSAAKEETVLFNTDSNKIVWSVEHDADRKKVMSVPEGVLITFNKGKTILIDKNTGKVKWEKKFFPVYYDGNSHIAIGYTDMSMKKLCGIDMEENLIKWDIKLPAAYGIADIRRMNGNRIVMASDNLSSIDLETGNVVSHKMKIGKPIKLNLDEDIIAIGATLGYGLIGGAVIGMTKAKKLSYSSILPTDANHYYNMCSHIAVDNRNIYFADRHAIHAYNLNLEELWSTEFTSGEAGESGIIIDDNRIVVINTALKSKGDGEKLQSKKFFYAMYDRNTGKLIKESPLSELIEDANAITNILTDTVYAYNTEKHSFSMLCPPRNGTCIATSNGRLYTIDSELKTEKIYDKSGEIYRVCFSSPAYNIINCDDDTWVVQKDGTPIAHIKKSMCNPTVAGNNLVGHTKRTNQIINVPLKFKKGDTAL